MWTSHIATTRLEMAFPARLRCATWASERFKAAAHRLAQISPSTIPGLALVTACRLA